MITFKFELEKQEVYYKIVKEKLKTQFYQNLKFYVLPFMPEKFRNRVIYFPETCELQKIYKRQRQKIENLETSWNRVSITFTRNLKMYFPKVDDTSILISPTFYGSLGSYELHKNEICVYPRYDRKIVGLQKLVITALTHYHMFNGVEMDKNKNLWLKKQQMASEIQSKLLTALNNSKSMLDILDTEFAGKLAQESTIYLKKLNMSSKKTITKPGNLTEKENTIFNLLFQNKNKLVSFDEIGNWLWPDKSDEKYSEYAITKLIERLKKKLPNNSIHNQRGTGYLLHI